MYLHHSLLFFMMSKINKPAHTPLDGRRTYIDKNNNVKESTDGVSAKKSLTLKLDF